MASYLQVENLSKSYGPRTLFRNISFNINEGDKIALIAPNGTGKTSLLNILAGKDSSDGEGKVTFLRNISIAFLEQEHHFHPDSTVFEVVYGGSGNKARIIRNYESALLSGDKKELEKAITAMDQADAWNYEQEIKEILYSLKLEKLDQKIKELSGGEIKRVAIGAMLINRPDFLIMDEPTNHLDLETIEYLETYLSRSRCTLLMVTHDRYFLDRVCNQILELADGTLYSYKGNYSYFLEKREERERNFKAETERARNLFRRELDWIRRTPCARGTKAKYRVEAFTELKEKAFRTVTERNLDINHVGISRLGKKIIYCKHLKYVWEDFTGVEDFTYNFAPGEKIGIVGKNGVGKSTFLNLLAGNLKPTGGEIETGETVVFGYYKQSGMQFDPEDTVIDTVRKIAEVVTLNDGKTVPASAFLNYFLFPPDTHYTKVERLSGGEKRRLYLLTVLMKNPNFLILDEPTNDLDLLTLNVLEEYLKNFAGSLLIVSHDRFFLDKLADHLFIFEGNGKIKDFVGSYSGYREYIKEREKEKRESQKRLAEKSGEKERRKAKENVPENPSQDFPESRTGTGKKKKLSYKEQRESDALEKEIESLEKEKQTLEESLSSGTLNTDQLMEASCRIGTVMELLDEKTLRWLELNE